MSEELFLSGRVRRIRLPVFHQPTGPEAPALKRLRLPQGELAQFHDGEAGMHYIAFIELTPGGTRGHHFHKRKREWVYIISGKIELLVENLADQTRAVLPVEAGELVVIEPDVAHALRTVESGHAVEFSPSRHDPTDTYRHPLG